MIIEVKELIFRGEGIVLVGLIIGIGFIRFFFVKVVLGERVIFREEDVFWGEGEFLGVVRVSGSRVGFFLVGSFVWVGEIGVFIGEVGIVWRFCCVGDFISIEVERFLGFLEVGKGEIGIFRVVVIWGVGSFSGVIGVIFKIGGEVEFLFIGFDEIGDI